MTTAALSHRPAIVTIALVFVYLSGLSNTALGIVVLLSRYRVPAGDVLPVSLLGAGIVMLGLLTLAVASAIARGSRLARGLVTAYLAVIFALHVLTIVGTDWDWVSIVQMAVEAFIVLALWAPPGSRHFARPAGSAPQAP